MGDSLMLRLEGSSRAASEGAPCRNRRSDRAPLQPPEGNQ